MRAAGVAVCAIQLPGRETRLGEPPLERLEDVVGSLIPALTPYLDSPRAEPRVAGALVSEVAALGGIPRVILAEPELMRLTLPGLRADVAINETYRDLPEPPARGADHGVGLRW
ncbi:MAG: thioesterase II family protein [Solirubrobacteraceae bacterium]